MLSLLKSLSCLRMSFVKVLFRCWAGVLIVACLAGCTTMSKDPRDRRMPEVLTADVLALKYQLNWYLDGLTYIVRFENGTTHIKCMVGSQVVLVGDRRLLLNDPVQMKEGKVILPRDFPMVVMGGTPEVFHKQDSIFKLRKYKKIVVDAGHGGKTLEPLDILELMKKTLFLMSLFGLRIF